MKPVDLSIRIRNFPLVTFRGLEVENEGCPYLRVN